MRPSFLSLKWKFSFALTLLAMGLVGIYVGIAKTTFESDKISYVFDAQQAQAESLSHDLRQQFERIVFESRAVLSAFDFDENALNPLGQKLFDDHRSLISIELRDEEKNTVVAQVIKDKSISRTVSSNSPGDQNSGEMKIEAVGDGHYLITVSYRGKKAGEKLTLKTFASADHLLPVSTQTSMILAQGNRVVASSGPTVDVRELLEDLNRDRAGSTSLRKIASENYLVSSTAVLGNNLKLFSLTNENTALGALGILYHRSILFLAFSTFATILIALIMSTRLTRSLAVLSVAAEKIGQGEFDRAPDVRTNDEIGLLATAFGRMSSEIQRLLQETKEKTRMEAELKTAKLVQENLFPEKTDFHIGKYNLSAKYLTSTECGGDWWYYFVLGKYLFVTVADATGHGTPAALITSAARSIFSDLESKHLSPPEMFLAWNKAIRACSKGKICMTAFLVRIDTETGKVEMLNASHEQAMILSAKPEGFVTSFTKAPVNPTLGETQGGQWVSGDHAMEPGDIWLLITDGLTGVVNPEGKVLGESRFARFLSRISLSEPMTSRKVSDAVSSYIEDFRKGATYPDDVTYVVVQREQGG